MKSSTLIYYAYALLLYNNNNYVMFPAKACLHSDVSDGIFVYLPSKAIDHIRKSEKLKTNKTIGASVAQSS